MEKFKFDEKRETFLGWAFINAITQLDKELGESVTVQNVVAAREEEGIDQLQLFANGVELPVMETFEELHNRLDEMIREKAVELLDEKFNGVSEFMYEIEGAVRRAAKEKLGVEVNWDD